jgi:hypothetical protein
VLSTANNSFDDLVKNVNLVRLQEVLDKKQKFRFMLEGIGKKILMKE